MTVLSKVFIFRISFKFKFVLFVIKKLSSLLVAAFLYPIDINLLFPFSNIIAVSALIPLFVLLNLKIGVELF